MAANNGIFAALERKAEVSEVEPARHIKLRTVAENLSRRSVDMATCELLNEAFARLALLCYERDDDGGLCNVDAATGRILIPLCWGKAGHAKWGLSPSESDAMRAIMFARQQNGLPLFFFDRSRKSWFLNIVDFPNGAEVLSNFKEWEITVSEYRQARDQRSRKRGRNGGEGSGPKYQL